MKYALTILVLSMSVVFGQSLTNTTLDGVTNATINSVIDDDADATRAALGLGTSSGWDSIGLAALHSHRILASGASNVNSGVLYVAVEIGEIANDITVSHVIDGSGSAASVGVAGRVITVTAGSNCTQSSIVTAVNGSTPAAALVTAYSVGTGTTLVRARAAVALQSPINQDTRGNITIGNPVESAISNSSRAISAPTDGPGNLYLQDMKYFGWKREDGAVGPNIYYWDSHDAIDGEWLFSAPWRSAWIQTGPFQFGSNASGRDAQCLHMVSGASTVADTIKQSKAITFQSKVYNGGVEKIGYAAMQASQSSASGDSTFLKINISESPADGPVNGFTNGSSEVGVGGTLTGTTAARISVDGIYSPGLAPAYATLTPGATITWTLNEYHAQHQAKVTLGQSSTLAINGQVAGMRGVLYVKQPTGGGPYTLTLPDGSTTIPGWALSTGANTTDRLAWEFDGSVYFWTMIKGYPEPTDSAAAAFIAATGITDDAQETAINNLVLSLKGASLWTRAHAIYPFIGGTAASHAVDLKATSNITNNAAWQASTHDGNGVTGNGTTSFGDLGFGPDDVGTQDSVAVTIYSRTTVPTLNGTVIGAQTNGSHRTGLQRTKPSSTDYVAGGISASSLSTIQAATGDDWASFIVISRTASTSSFIRVNGANTVSGTASSGVSAFNFYINANNASGTSATYSNANLAWVAVYDGLSQAEALTLETIVEAYQDELARGN